MAEQRETTAVTLLKANTQVSGTTQGNKVIKIDFCIGKEAPQSPCEKSLTPQSVPLLAACIYRAQDLVPGPLCYL